MKHRYSGRNIVGVPINCGPTLPVAQVLSSLRRIPYLHGRPELNRRTLEAGRSALKT